MENGKGEVEGQERAKKQIICLISQWKHGPGLLTRTGETLEWKKARHVLLQKEKDEYNCNMQTSIYFFGIKHLW